MSTINQELLAKYFSGVSTVLEATLVLDWLNTPEGEGYLAEELKSILGESTPPASASDEVNFAKLLERIKLQIQLHEGRIEGFF